MNFERRPTIFNEFPSAPHMLVQLVLRVEKKEMKMPVQQVTNKLSGESGGKAMVKVDFRKEEEQSVSLSMLATMPKVVKRRRAGNDK